MCKTHDDGKDRQVWSALCNRCCSAVACGGPRGCGWLSSPPAPFGLRYTTITPTTSTQMEPPNTAKKLTENPDNSPKHHTTKPCCLLTNMSRGGCIWQYAPVLQHDNVCKLTDRVSGRSWYIKWTTVHEARMYAHLEKRLQHTTQAVGRSLSSGTPPASSGHAHSASCRGRVFLPPHCVVHSPAVQVTLPLSCAEPNDSVTTAQQHTDEPPSVCLSDTIPGHILRGWVSYPKDCASVFLVTLDVHASGFYPATHRLRSPEHLMQISCTLIEFETEMGVVHNDLSAENVLVRIPAVHSEGNGQGIDVCIIDWEMSIRTDRMWDWEEYHVNHYWKQCNSCLSLLMTLEDRQWYGVCFDINRFLCTCWSRCSMNTQTADCALQLADLLRNSEAVSSSSGHVLDRDWFEAFGRTLLEWVHGESTEHNRCSL
jgi:hypothetical protein